MDNTTTAPRPSSSIFTRDHLLTALIGILAGFIGGYLVGQKEAAPRAAIPAAATASAPAPQVMGAPAGEQAISPEARAQIAELEKMFSEAPQSPELALQLGHAYYDTRQFARAIEMYERVLPARPADPNLLTDLGVCYRNSGNVDKALQLFEQASAADSNHWQSKFNQAIIYSFDRGNQKKALAILAELKKNPKAVEAVGQLERAIKAHSEMGKGDRPGA